MELYNYKATCDRVVDGDTIDVTIDLGFDITIKQRVRVVGIDTPESRTKDLLEKSAGLFVKEYLRMKLEGKEILIKTTLGDKGKYGRVLGEIFTDGILNESVNDHLLRMGFARKYFGGTRTQWDRDMLANISANIDLLNNN